MRNIILCILSAILFVGCNTARQSDGKKTIYVTIAPLRMLVEEVSCHDFDVEVLVPRGASPENFEPTVGQLKALHDAQYIFSTGLITFEQGLLSAIDDRAKIADLSCGITTIEGSCTHHHHKHSHGIDPHIWTSPRALRTMVENIHGTLRAAYPDSAKYGEAAERLMARLDSLDDECRRAIAEAGVKAMMIYHPAYTYYARDYGIEQIAIEHDGKEPSPKRLVSLVEMAHKNNITTILYQPQYGEEKLRAIARECGADIVMTDPLAEDIIREIERVTEIICHRDAE